MCSVQLLMFAQKAIWALRNVSEVQRRSAAAGIVICNQHRVMHEWVSDQDWIDQWPSKIWIGLDLSSVGRRAASRMSRNVRDKRPRASQLLCFVARIGPGPGQPPGCRCPPARAKSSTVDFFYFSIFKYILRNELGQKKIKSDYF
jgi:hypothetical protein